MSWFLWWSGKIGPYAVGDGSEEEKEAEKQQKVALIVGVTGIVGSILAEILPRSNTPRGPWKVYGVSRRPRPHWSPDTRVEHIQCDVLNKEDTLEKISPLTDVTHIFWVVWAKRDTEEENSEANGRMFQNVLDALFPNAPNLQHVCLQTGIKQYMGPFSLFGKITPHEAPFREDLPRLSSPNFYHTLEDILFENAKRKIGLTWSIHRPSVIFGFSPWSLMNLVGTLAVYASICKREKLPFRYPGNRFSWERFTDASDAGLIAEQEIWAATSAKGGNQAFNCANGDVFRWKRLWHVLADRFQLEVPPYDGVPFSLEEAMRDKGPTWDAIVEENELQKTGLQEVGCWWFADTMLNSESENVSNMNKCKERGFFGFRNTERSLAQWIDKLGELKIIP